MHQVADGNVQSIKCNQMNTNGKNKSKKAKDPSDTSEDLSILDQEKLNDVLANTLHINNFNSNLTNGTSGHLKDEISSDSSVISEAQTAIVSEVPNDVNSVQCREVASDPDKETDSPPHLTRYPFENAVDIKEINSDTHEQAPRDKDDIDIISYESELQMPEIMRLIQKDLSEPYSIYTYRYFIHNWPKLCFLAIHEGTCIGAIVCKLDMHRNVVKRGYIAMLAVDEKYRKRKIGSRLVRKAIQVINTDHLIILHGIPIQKTGNLIL